MTNKSKTANTTKVTYGEKTFSHYSQTFCIALETVLVTSMQIEEIIPILRFSPFYFLPISVPKIIVFVVSHGCKGIY